ncbi:MAG TPA: hypothetical protein H9751_09475 [Candidatus Corynebacterium faecigallinarum]|uniref:J domain-containing protein n=1 Tax=Candidatus Corynebacterium faecigallinarum TaxID=2838528 RepID=A0A9D2QGQ6_9CORY|nr:hypothetical protein [Candidatus Corynebacterium faecigallinarum]
MAHYDIYQSLGLERFASSTDLAQQIDDRLAAVGPGDAGAREELTVARSILGDETRRGLYDQRLDDPSAAEIDIDSLRELASLNLGGQAGGSAAPTGSGKGQQFQQQAGQFARTAGAKTAEASHQVQDSFKQSKGLAIIVTAVVTAVVVGVAGWALGLFGKTEDKAAKGLVNEMLDKNNSDDLRSWIQDNSTHQDRDEVMSSLKLSGDDSFNGMDALFGGSDLSAGTRVLDAEQLKMSLGSSSKDFYEGAEDEGYTREEIDSTVFIAVIDKNDKPRGAVGMLERDGDFQIIAVETLD